MEIIKTVSGQLVNQDKLNTVVIMISQLQVRKLGRVVKKDKKIKSNKLH